jgi:Ca-activated chloride channel homolog
MLSSWNILVWEYEFLSPKWLWLLLLVPVCFVWMLVKERSKSGEMKFSKGESDQQLIHSDWIIHVRFLVIGLYNFIAVLLILALAKPLDWDAAENSREEYKNGIDILLAMDVSMSMMARDFQPNRLEASKRVAKEFVEGRKADRIGLVVYAGEAYTACPITLDHSILLDQIDKITGENIDPGTAIGTGLGTAVGRLRNDSLPSKVIILLTDGSNNYGDITPEIATELARAKNIRVYTIGVGTNGEAPSPVITPFGVRFENIPVEIDEKTLIDIAEKTNGKYFRATDEKSLNAIYKEIDQLEKRKMLDKRYSSEPPATPTAFLNWAFLLMIVSWSTSTILFRTHE